VCLLHFPSDQSSRGTAVALGLGDEADQVRCFALQFFDDDELVLVLENAEKRRYLATIDYQSLRKDMVDLRFSTDFPIADLTNGIVQHVSPADVPVPFLQN
jgi:hypothetical protein